MNALLQKRGLVPACAALAVLAVLLFVSASRTEERAGEQPDRPRFSIAEDSPEIFRDEDALYAYVAQYGPKKTIAQLNALSAAMGSCHDTAHRAGRFAYELYGAEAFQTCSAECHSGCYHGATEAYFRDNGTANLAENLSVICGSAQNAFFSHQCLHGIGHGLMAWANYGLGDALDSCDLLPDASAQQSCYTGVFMENIVGSLGEQEGHFTNYLSDDPQYPCTIVDAKYKDSCYFLQTSRMLQLFGPNFAEVARVCGEAPEAYRFSCFGSMGRDVGGTHRNDPAGAIAACGNAPEGDMRIACQQGAVQDTFWDPSGQDAAIAFCNLLQEPFERDACWSTVLGRAPEVLLSQDERRVFCGKVASDQQERCRGIAGL